jgi:hypothetical protein
MSSIVHLQGRAIYVTTDSVTLILAGKGISKRCSYQLLPYKDNEGKYFRSTFIYN